MIMDKSLIDKLKEVMEQHQKDTGERVQNLQVTWLLMIGGNANIESINLEIKK